MYIRIAYLLFTPLEVGISELATKITLNLCVAMPRTNAMESYKKILSEMEVASRNKLLSLLTLLKLLVYCLVFSQ